MMYSFVIGSIFLITAIILVLVWLESKTSMFKDHSCELKTIRELLWELLERIEHLDKKINDIAKDTILIKRKLHIFHYSSAPMLEELHKGNIENLVCDWLLIDIDMPATTIWHKIVGELIKSNKINARMKEYAEWEKETMTEWLEVVECMRNDIKENKLMEKQPNVQTGDESNN